MKRINCVWIAFAGVVLILSGCATPKEDLLEEGHTSMTTDEITELISGKTYTEEGWAVYHAPDGTYDMAWIRWVDQGIPEHRWTGTWWVEEPNKLCFGLTWNDAQRCSEYYQFGDQISRLYGLDRKDTHRSQYKQGNLYPREDSQGEQ
ncbi:MAG: DUF995 domain-containing protein [Pseudomonadota bacterium]